MKVLRKYLNRITRLKEGKELQRIAKEREILDYIVLLNTDEQLYQGVDSQGTPLKEIGGDYAPFTKSKKQREGQPTNRITLFDEGDFYNSFKATAAKKGISIDADYTKPGTDLRDRWGNELAGLTDESLEDLRKEFLPPLRELFKPK